MSEETNKRGRPILTDEEKKEILQKLEPYLKGGLPVSKALIEAGISNGTFYKYMREDGNFSEKVNQYRNFTAILLNNAIVGELQAIIKKQQGYTDKATGKKFKPQPLKKEDREFLWKYALNSNMTKDMFGERKDVSLWDPEAEIQRVRELLESGSTKDLPPLPEDAKQLL